VVRTVNTAFERVVPLAQARIRYGLAASTYLVNERLAIKGALVEFFAMPQDQARTSISEGWA